MRVCLISGPALATTHGTGAQMLRTFAGGGVDFLHLYWSSRPFGRSEHPASYLLEDAEWRLPVGGRVARQVGFRLGSRWWLGYRVNARKLRGLVRRAGAPPDVAYVVVASDEECARALSILACLGCPYVVHLMDIVHEHGLDPAMANYRRLLEHASSVLALNGALEHEAAKFRISDLRVVSFGQEPSDRVARPPEPGGGLRVLLSGSVLTHQDGMRLLAAAWPRLAARHPGSRLVYVGADAAVLAPELRAIADSHGYLTTEEYQRVVEGSHLAYVAGPSGMSTIGRFSVPSRTSDYLMAGLPVVAHLAPESAAAAFLAPLVPAAARVVRGEDDLVEAVGAFARSEDAWRAASAEARAFALRRLSADVVRAQVFDALARAANR